MQNIIRLSAFEYVMTSHMTSYTCNIIFYLLAVTEDITVEEIELEEYDYFEDIEEEEKSQEMGKNQASFLLFFFTIL